MTTDLMPFTYEGLKVRTVIVDGEPWFVAADVATVLEYRMASDMTRRLDGLDKGYAKVRTPGGEQDMAVINESGLYDAVFRSNAVGAKEFRRWVTAEVIPSIRLTGSYGAPTTAPALTEDEIIQQGYALTMKRVEALTAEVAELKPKADLADTYLTAQGGARLVREAAKLLNLREKELRRFLLDEKLIFTRHAPCGDVQYDHYAQFAHHFKVTEHIVRHTWGNCSHYTLTVLPRGMELITRRLRAYEETAR